MANPSLHHLSRFQRNLEPINNCHKPTMQKNLSDCMYGSQEINEVLYLRSPKVDYCLISDDLSSSCMYCGLDLGNMTLGKGHTPPRVLDNNYVKYY